MFKRCLKLFLLVFAVFTVSFIMLSCGAKEKSKIYIKASKSIQQKDFGQQQEAYGQQHLLTRG